MPFGAEIQDDGSVRFALWAPGARQVELALQESVTETFLPLTAQPDGWFLLATDRAGPGSRYRFRIDGDLKVPDPASRYQPADVHGPSEVVKPHAFEWRDGDWRGRPWEETVVYELHVGAFTAAGDFAAVAERLDHLVDLGVTAMELMPVAAFPGARNWGYDGVLPFAPDASYGRPEDLKMLVQEAHARGLMVFLDVVYNHFGPEGNYLHAYAPDFFTERHHTPWGAAINFDGPGSATVREYFVHNALYWLEEYHLDGLRLDAVHAILDDSAPDILEELAAAVAAGPARRRHVHLILENDDNAARYLERDAAGAPRHYVAQWNDDIHHALHTLVTGETDGYYADYADRPVWYLGRCLAEGFGYQGEPSPFRDGARRGADSRHLPPTAFVSFLQNHDQVGNRALGERMAELAEPDALQAALAVMLLAPSPPLLFMGDEFCAPSPFQFFCDFGADLAADVTAGRRREFARFERFADPAAQEAIPDPNDPATFEGSRLDWTTLAQDTHRHWLEFYRGLLALRREHVVPLLPDLVPGTAGFGQPGPRALWVTWRLAGGGHLGVAANLGPDPLPADAVVPAQGDVLYAHPAQAADPQTVWPPWSVVWRLRKGVP